MAHEHHPIQNSEVYLVCASHAPSVPPPSPPSPAEPCDRGLSPPLDDLMSMTPPEVQDSSSQFSQRLSTAVHVLNTEATALSCLTRVYETEPIARGGFNSAVEIIKSRIDRGKLVICGVGKSGHIAKKLVATMNSLNIYSEYLHPTEALHGDMGKVREHDTILLITFSGSTPELFTFLPHIKASIPIIIMTSHTHPSTCALIKDRPDAILLPAPIHESETHSFGFNAPTTSTTVALALGDALAVAISNELHTNIQAVFSQNHPGGAIGKAVQVPKKVSDVTVPFELIPEMKYKAITGAHVLMSAYKSMSGWVRLGDDIVVPPRRIQLLQPDDMEEPATCLNGLMVQTQDWIQVPADMAIPQARDFIMSMRNKGESKYSDDAILATVFEDEIIGVVEVGTLLA